MYALPSLKGATIYYARTYATNKSGLTGYGEVKSFTTPNIFENKNIYPELIGNFLLDLSLMIKTQVLVSML